VISSTYLCSQDHLTRASASDRHRKALAMAQPNAPIETNVRIVWSTSHLSRVLAQSAGSVVAVHPFIWLAVT
jgi:hypothetical protein